MQSEDHLTHPHLIQSQNNEPTEHTGGSVTDGNQATQDEPSLGHGLADISNQLLDSVTHSNEDVDENDDTWTQISGPCDEEMSVSDDSSTYSTVQYQRPKIVLDAEHNSTHHRSGAHPIPEVHQRYKDFATFLCKETGTNAADRHVQEGIPIAVETARSIQLDEPITHDEDGDLYAFALIIHVWQIVCIRMQHGEYPSASLEVSLCLYLATYSLSAHTIVNAYCTVSSDELRYAVQYWEERLKTMGLGNQWMQARWARDIPLIDQTIMIHRNETADRYLEALETYGKEGLTISIIEQENKGDRTQLRTMVEQSADAVKGLRRQIVSMLYSMDTSLLKAMIQGQLPRLAEFESGPVYQALRELNEQKDIQPGTYMNCVCDHFGLSPTPDQWQRVCEQMLSYVQFGTEHNDLAQQVDQQIHPRSDWPGDLAHKGLRRYTELRSFLDKGSYTPDIVHRRWVKYFVDQLRKRMEGHLIHAPLKVPVVEIGFSNDPRKRLRQHRHHESSNYLMNLAEAVFATEYPGSFRLQQRIVFACYRPIQTWLSEIIVTQLAQGYVEGGAGFSHELAGRSNTSSNSKVPARVWNQFEAKVYADGRFEQEVEANSQRLQARKLATAQEEEQRKKDAEAQRSLHAARVAHLRNLIAREEARKSLYDALSRRLDG